MTDQDIPTWMIFQPDMVTKEPVQTKITGKIPKWLTGSLYRNGPGLFVVGDTRVNHLFDGLAVLHKFSIRDGEVFYQNKLLDSVTMEKCEKANRLVVAQFATGAFPDPCKSLFSRIFSYFVFDHNDITDNTSVNIVPHGDQMFAMTETPFVNQVDPGDLKTLKQIGLHKIIAVHLSTAHPHIDEDGSMYNLGTSFNYTKAYNIVKIPKQEKGGENTFEKVQIISSFPSRWRCNISYNHSFGMSENYFIILEQPLVMNVLKLPILQLSKGGIWDVFGKYPDEKSLFNLLSRKNGKKVRTKFTADAFFCFHFINCYEEKNHLMVDMCVHDDLNVIDDLKLSKDLYLEGKASVSFKRYVLPLDEKKAEVGENLVTLPDMKATAVKMADGSIYCTPDTVTDDPLQFELPRINYAYNAKKYNYVYGSTFLAEPSSKLVKLDIQGKKATQWVGNSWEQPGEPVFIAQPNGKDEDDGVILSPIISLDPKKPCSLLILDAKSFTELARAETLPGVKMPASFHGSFVKTKV